MGGTFGLGGAFGLRGAFGLKGGFDLRGGFGLGGADVDSGEASSTPAATMALALGPPKVSLILLPLKGSFPAGGGPEFDLFALGSRSFISEIKNGEWQRGEGKKTGNGIYIY